MKIGAVLVPQVIIISSCHGSWIQLFSEISNMGSNAAWLRSLLPNVNRFNSHRQIIIWSSCLFDVENPENYWAHLISHINCPSSDLAVMRSKEGLRLYFSSPASSSRVQGTGLVVRPTRGCQTISSLRSLQRWIAV